MQKKDKDKENRKKKIKEVIKKEREEKEGYLEGWKRAKSDLVNYKKDELKRMNGYLFYEKKKILLKIISILDSFQRAEKEVEKRDNDEIIGGFLIIKKQLEMFLSEEGVEKIDAVGKEFDPQFHEAVEVVEDSEKSGVVVEELEKGYLLDGEVIRASKVKVAQ